MNFIVLKKLFAFLFVIGLVCPNSLAWCQSKAESDSQKKTLRDLSDREYQEALDTWVPKGFRPVDAQVKVVDNVPRFTLILEKPEKTSRQLAAKHGLDDAAYRSEFLLKTQLGLNQIVHRTYTVHGRRLHLAIWKQASVKSDVLKEQLEKRWSKAGDVPVTGQAVRGFEPVDQMMRELLFEQKISGATIAIGYKGKLLYSRGFGYGEVENQVAMQPNALMRIASISKPVTGVAIMRLVQQKKLGLDDPVLNYVSHDQANIKTFDKRWEKITIRHLLNHSAGFDRGKSGDPMFMHLQVASFLKKKLPVGTRDIIDFMLSRKLDFDPGTKYAYSNFGYCLLGRVIEKVTGKSYESFVREEILKPADVKRMQVGAALLKQRVKSEPIYYSRKPARGMGSVGDQVGKRVAVQYGAYSVVNMDSHGGWIASSEDLVRFSFLADSASKAKILNPDSIRQMFSMPEFKKEEQKNRKVKRYYGFGWSIVEFGNRQKNTFHSGSLPGTNSILVRRSDGYCWAVIFNCRNTVGGKSAANTVDARVHRAVNQSKKNLSGNLP